MSQKPASTRRPLATSPFNKQAELIHESYADGDRVTHDKHGVGKVVRVEETTCVVAFGQDVFRRVTMSDPRLSKL